VLENYEAVQRALGLSEQDLRQLANNSIAAAFLEPAEKERLTAALG